MAPPRPAAHTAHHGAARRGPAPGPNGLWLSLVLAPAAPAAAVVPDAPGTGVGGHGGPGFLVPPPRVPLVAGAGGAGMASAPGLSFTAVPKVSDEQCALCKPDATANGTFRPWSPCKAGRSAESRRWCDTNLCVGYDDAWRASTATCLSSYGQEEYMETYWKESVVASTWEDAAVLGIIPADDEHPPPKPVMMHEDEGNFLFLETARANQHRTYLLLPGYIKPEGWWSHCGIVTLTIGLNYLGVGAPLFSGKWRWLSEAKVLQVYPKVEARIDFPPAGTSLAVLRCIAEDMGLRVRGALLGGPAATLGVTSMTTPTPAAQAEVEFRQVLKFATSSAHFRDALLLVNYFRNLLGQPGSGHWSPVAGYAPERDMVLIAEVAQYKSPPHWVRLRDLVRAMNARDEARGWLLLERGGAPRARPRVCAWDSSASARRASSPSLAGGGDRSWVPEAPGLSQRDVEAVMRSAGPECHMISTRPKPDRPGDAPNPSGGVGASSAFASGLTRSLSSAARATTVLLCIVPMVLLLGGL